MFRKNTGCSSQKNERAKKPEGQRFPYSCQQNSGLHFSPSGKGYYATKANMQAFSDKKHSWLWELRPGGDRVLFFAWTGGAFVLLHAFRKQSQKTPDSELHKAEREYKDWIERNGKI